MYHGARYILRAKEVDDITVSSVLIVLHISLLLVSCDEKSPGGGCLHISWEGFAASQPLE